MDILGLEVGKRDNPGDGLVDAVNIFVNGRNLADLLREVGLPFAARGHLSASSRLLGEPPTYYDHDNPEGKIAILGCGDLGCWPFRVKVTPRDDAIIWSEFEQPHRSVWRYDALRPFVFDRAQYISVLNQNSG